MRRRRKAVRLISRARATVAVGGLLGFLVPTIAADLAPPPVAAARDVVPESPWLAHALHGTYQVGRRPG